jgi:hypothetical protein
MSRALIEMPYGMPPAAGDADPDRTGELALTAATLAFAAGVVHLALIVPHLSRSLALAVLFSLAGVAEIGWSVVFSRLGRPGIQLAGQALLISVVAGWLMSRTMGLPLGGDAAHPEPFGPLDCLTTGCELLALYALTRPRRAAPVVYAGLTLAVLLLLTLATLGHHALS